MWFHHRHDLDGGLLYTQDSSSISRSRGFTRGAEYAVSFLPNIKIGDGKIFVFGIEQAVSIRTGGTDAL